MTHPPPPSGKKPVSGRQRTIVLGVDKAVYWFSRHWLAVFNTLAALYVGLPILAPMLMAAGATRPAQAIYTLYSPMCHQMASRSLFLLGEQYAYPRAIAGSDLRPIDDYLDGLPEFANVSAENWIAFTLAARQFLGNEEMGYKMALCARDIGIYGFVLLGGLLYGLLRRRMNVKALPFIAFVIIGMGPIGLDGFSQLFGYWATPTDGSAPGAIGELILRVFPLRESTPFLRTFTGAWFGLTLVWLAYPHVEEGMKDTARDLEAKLRRAGEL